MNEETQLKPCPFCGGYEDLHVRETWVVAGYKWYVSCGDCWTAGPMSATGEAAIEEWNSREQAQLSLVDDYALYFHEACKLQESNSPKAAQPMPFNVWLAAQKVQP